MSSSETTAIIYGAAAGGIVSLFVNTGLYLLNRYVLQRLGGIKLDPPNDWKFSYLEWLREERSLLEDGTTVEVRYVAGTPPPQPSASKTRDANHATYSFTAQVHNRKDVAGILRDVRVAFMNEGERVFDSRPVNAGNDPLSDILEEMTDRRPRYTNEERNQLPGPGSGLDPVRVIQVPANDLVSIKLRGYISGTDLGYLRGGCDEVRLRGTTEPSPTFGRRKFDEHIASIKTSSHQFPSNPNPGRTLTE